MKIMVPVMQKDASHEVEGLIRTLDNRPDCEDYIRRLREAGHGSPYEGGTQYVLAHTYDAARKGGCVRPN